MKPKISKSMREEASLHARIANLSSIKARLRFWKAALEGWKDTLPTSVDQDHHMRIIMPAYNHARRETIIYIMSLEIKLGRFRWYREEF